MLRLGLQVAALVALLDQASKWVVTAALSGPPHTVRVTPFFDLVLHWNRGISFGLFDTAGEGARWVFVAVSLAVTAGLVWWLKKAERAFLGLAIALVIGGAVGNVIDRLRFGAVADFLSLHAAGYYWPAFNLADSAITVGVAMILIDSLFSRPRSSK